LPSPFVCGFLDWPIRSVDRTRDLQRQQLEPTAKDHAAFAVAILAQGIGVEAVGRQHWSENTRAGQRKGSTSAELRRERDVRNYINIGNG
jgi:hypothetical protein